MPSGRLGKAYIPNSQDVAKLYEVPNAKIATFNINVVNLGTEATNVTVWISDSDFQDNDFETFLSSPVITDMVDYPVSKVIGKGDYYLFLPKRGGSFQTAAPYIRYAKITGATNTTAGNTGEVTIGKVPVQGDIMHFWSGTNLYVRQLYDAGNLYTIENFIDGGSAVTSGNTWGFQTTQPVQYAGDPIEATEATGSVVFYAKNNSATVGTLATNGFATSGNQTFTVYSFAAGSVQNIRPLKSGRYLLGTTGGQLYWSTNSFPSAAGNWAGSAIPFNLASAWNAESQVDGNAPSIGLPLMMEAASSATRIFVVCTNLSGNNFVLRNQFANASDTNAPVDNWDLVTFPEQIADIADMVDFYIDNYGRPVIKTSQGQNYVSDDFGETWFEAYESGLEGMWSNVTIDAGTSNILMNAIRPEVEMYRGYTYYFNQSDTTNNGNPLLFSTAKEGTANETASQNFVITVQNSTVYGGNVYVVDGVEKRGIQLQRGGTYTFDLSDASTSSHPFTFSATNDGTHNSGTAYTTNVVASGAQGTEGAKITFTVPNGAPDSLYIFCSTHSGMGFAVDVVDDSIDEGFGGYLGNPTGGDRFALSQQNKADYQTNFATYNGEVRLVSFTVPMDAPDTIYAYTTTADRGFSIKVSGAPADQDSNSHLLTLSVYDIEAPDAGDEMKRKEIYADGTNRNRNKRYFGLFEEDFQADILDKLGLATGGVLERTGIVASAGEKVFVQSGGQPLSVRVHGIEE